MAYVVDFYDMIDGWIHGHELYTDWRFGEDFVAAVKKATELQSKLGPNVAASEHYGVIDLLKGREVWCPLDYK